jgi:hypothetical protein
MLGDHLKQETTEASTERVIRESKEICSVLREFEIPVEDVLDYHRYPIADNDAPRLSSDRLEYTLENMVRYGIESAVFQKAAAQDLIVGENEEGEEELVFQSEAIAEKFAMASVACGRIYSGAEDRYAMEMLAGLLKRAVETGVLSEALLYAEEPRVIDALLKSPLKEDWLKYRRLHAVYETEDDGPDVISVRAKKRYIDPYVKGKGRIRQLSSAFEETVKAFMAEDYSVKLKGEF